MNHTHHPPSLRKRALRPTLSLLVLAAALLGVSQVQGGGGGGGVEIYPFSSVSPPGTGTGQVPANRWITMHAASRVQVLKGSRSDSGVRVRQHSGSDLVRSVPPGASWSLDLAILSPTITLWEGPAMISLGGHYVLTDAVAGDGEDLRLHNGLDSVRSHLVVVLGQRRDPQSQRGVLESFSNVMQVAVLPVPDHQVSLEGARASLNQVLRGSGLDVALGLFSRDGNGELSQAWASFNTDDALGVFEIETR